MPGVPHTPALKRVFFKAFVITFIVALLFLLIIAEQTAGVDQSGKTTPKQFNVTSTSNDSASSNALTPGGSNLSTDSQISNNTGGSGSSSTQVIVNGRPVNVPENGTTTQTINNDGSTTTVTASGNHSDGNSSVSVESTTDSSGTATNNSTSNISVQSFNSNSP